MRPVFIQGRLLLITWGTYGFNAAMWSQIHGDIYRHEWGSLPRPLRAIEQKDERVLEAARHNTYPAHAQS